QNMKLYDTDKIHNSMLEIDDINYMLNALKNINTIERKKVIGLDPNRADIILAGLNILCNIMCVLKIPRIRVSEYDNLEGLIFYKLSLLKK
ncbi:MAG: Ppx/GppA family phosphatase, partial [Proteocatella sp.]